ncbi:MAG: hypothetical protein RR810_07100, partial [Clostridia bacterium]
LLGAKNFKYLDGDKFVGDVRKTGTENPKNYVVHPAFSAERRTGYTKRADGNFGSTEEIPGFWVSKFEMSAGCKSISGVTAEREITISDMFDKGKKIANIRGITSVDTMLMTTTQWGAVAYLAKAIGREPAINADIHHTTGGGDYIANVKQSTTGNTTGIYDMNGSAYETMSAYVNSGTLTDANGKNVKDNKNTKYVDVYAMGSGNTSKANYDANPDKYGDSLYEVSSNGDSRPMGWSNCYSDFPRLDYPVFDHGGCYVDEECSGVFSFGNGLGKPYYSSSWRGVCII